MRKIVKHPENIRLEGIVEKDGIGFIPEKHAGPMAISFNGCFAKVEEDGKNVACKNIYIGSHDEGEGYCVKNEMDEKIRKNGFKVLITSTIIIAMALIMMVVSIWLPNMGFWINVFSTIMYLTIFVHLLSKAFAILLGKIFRNKEMISFSKFLGAKNAVENAFYDLGRAPTLEEAKKYSLYSSEDKYTQRSYMAFLWLILSCVRFLNGWAYWIITICAILLLCLLEWNEKLAFVQAMVVSNPDEVHYKAAIAAMEDVADTLNHVEVHYHEFEVPLDPENFDEEKCSECPAYDFCKEESQKMAKEKDNDESND